MIKLIPGALLAAGLGLVNVTASIQPASAQPMLATLKLPLPSPTSTPRSTLPSTSVLTPQVATAATATTSVVAGIDQVEGKVAESTVSTVGNLAGASTDSRTGVGLNLPTSSDQVETSVQELVNDPVDHSGTASVVVSGNKDRIDGDAGIDLTVKAGNLAVGRICLDGDASIGSAGDKSLANCKTDHPKPQPIPEPSVTGALVLMGAYFVARYRRSKTTTTQ